MALRKIRLGEYVVLSDEKNDKLELTLDNVRGISTQKMFIDTKANMEGVSLNNYRIVRPNQFAYVPDTSRRGDKISLAFNDTDESFLVSSISVVFSVNEKKINPIYLFMYFNRPEFDRYSRYNSWGSARETFSWEDMCDIEMELPDLKTQQKYIDVYFSMIKNQKAYERGLEDLKLVCDAYIEDLRRKMPCKSIGKYLTLRTDQNIDMKFGHKDVKGVSQEKKMIETKSDTKGNDISKFTIIYPNDFIYNPRNGIAIALNSTNKNYIISWNNTAFYINNKFKEILLPEYLMMWLSRSEWNRKVKVDSWGSSTEVYSFEALGTTRVPIPKMEIQNSIVNLYLAYENRKEINEKLKQQIKDICPILIKGSIVEGV